MLETLGMPNSSLGVPGGQPALTCLGIGSSKGCHASTCSGICQSRSQEVNMPQPAQDPIPRDLISRKLSHFSLPGDLNPELGMPGSQVATVPGRISFKETHPEGSPPMEIEGSLLVFSFFFPSLSSLSFRWEITSPLPNRCP